jgi:hypothetical protein
MAQSGGSYISYNKPRPFTVPVIWERQGALGIFSRSTLIPRETLHYSASALEEIMVRIDEEYTRRELSKPTWKAYNKTNSNGSLDFDSFGARTNGNNLQNVPVKFFPQIIEDIQDAIDTLIADTRIPDSRAAFLARVFANNTGVPHDGYTSVSKLKDNILTLNGTLSPLTLAQAGSWPFTSGYILGAKTFKGIGAEGDRRVQLGPGGIETTDTNYPLPEWGGTIGNAAGFDEPFKSTNRPNFSRINATNTSLGVGAGKTDYDQGYGYFGHLPHVVQMVRWQPPIVEWFPSNRNPRDFVENVFSRTTPNLNWVLGQPTETLIQQNWGFWLVKGYVGVQDNKALIRAYHNPRAQSGSISQCPFSVFFPPPETECSCGWGESAYFIWFSNTSSFAWNSLSLFQSAGERAAPKKFGPKTKLKVKIDGTTSGGSSVSLQRFMVGVRTARISSVNLQPFNYVISQPMPFTGTLSVNLQEKLNEILGEQYPVGGTDQIDALILLVESRSQATWTCQAVDEGQGSFIPSSCLNLVQCTLPDVQVLVDYVHLDEESIQGDPVDDY